jgi:hypothetical protein
MASTAITTAMAGAINYTYVTDTSADWASVPNSTYFYDKADKLVHYKDITGVVQEIFSSGGGGLTVGTTAVTSGTDGRVFFQAGGVLQQEAGLTYTTGALLVGNTTAASKSGVRVWNGTTGNTAGAEFYIGTDNNIYLKTNNANNLYISTPTHNVISVISNQASITRLNVNGASTTPTLSVAAEATTSGSYPFYISGLASTRFTLHNGAGQFGINKPSNTLGANLDVSASGALSTDIVFRARNSADTANLFSINGDGTQNWFSPGNNALNSIKSGTYNLFQWGNENFGNVAIGYSSSNMIVPTTSNNTVMGAFASSGSSASFAVALGWGAGANSTAGISIGRTRVSGEYAIRIGYDGGASQYGGTNSIHLGRTVSGNDVTPDNVFMTYFNSQSSSTLTRSNGSFGLLGQQAYILGNGTGIYGVDTFMGNGGNTLVVSNHTSVPSTNITNSFQLYSNDITAGNAAPHFRTEAGNIIKLYQQSSAGITTVSDLVTVLQNLGLLS